MYSISKEEKSVVFKYFQKQFYSRQSLILIDTKEKKEYLKNPTLVFKIYPAVEKVLQIIDKRGRIRKKDFKEIEEVLKEFLDFYKSVKTTKEIYSYEEVREALCKIKCTDPGLYKVLWYSWFTDRSIVDISSSLFMDSSTFKRKCDKGISLLLGYLRNPSIISLEEATPIDIINPIYT